MELHGGTYQIELVEAGHKSLESGLCAGFNGKTA